jgi:NADH-quinone oxidoreductase subunit N
MYPLNIAPGDWPSILPALALVAGAILVVGTEAMVRASWRKPAAELLTYASLTASLFLVIGGLARSGGSGGPGFHDAVLLDRFALFLSLAILAATGLMVILSADSMRDRQLPEGEFHGLVLLGAAGMLFLVESVDLVTFFVSLEILSLSVYVLSGFFRKDPRSNEASVKYFVLGAFATGFLLYGMALLYGATGQLSIPGIGAVLAGSSPTAPGSAFARLGMTMLVIGLAFKVGAVPFHMWVADVYEGAPTAVTAFMSVSVKAAGFGALIRVLLGAGGSLAESWGPIVYALALVTMIVGNLMAIGQQSVKRMLAYSSIAHTGYVLVAVAALRSTAGEVREAAGAAALYYLFSYTFMTLGAFAFVILAGKGGKDAEDLEDYSGLAKSRPGYALAMAIFMVSLAGIPPTAGFLGKFMVFRSAVLAGDVPLVVVGVLASAVSVYYYLRVVVYMYMRPEEGRAERPRAGGVGWVVIASAGFTLILGILPSNYLQISLRSIQSILR